MNLSVDTKIKNLAQFIHEAERILIFTGAGISTESGISDYRSKGGLWDRFQPVTIQEFIASEEKRKQYWQQKLELYDSFTKGVAPNAGHRAIVEIERMGKLRGIVTQNIDGLHQQAGSNPQKILELHGTNRETFCLSCGEKTPWQDVYKRLQEGDEIPECLKCGGLLKPNTISFGQALDPQVLRTSFAWARDCDLLLAIGSTLVVEPAASIPRIAKECGARLVIITISETPLDEVADLKITASIGETLRQVMAILKNIQVS